MDGDWSRRGAAGSPHGADDSAADVLEQGGRRFPRPDWRPPRSAAILLAVGLAIGLVVGYAAGYRHGPASARPVHPQAAVSASATLVTGGAVPDEGGPALTQAGDTCYAQSGRDLQVGVQVTNGSAELIGLGRIHTVLPLGGLRVISQRWAPCGVIGPDQDPDSLGPGDSIWLSVTLRVLGGCPQPFPVQFTVDYRAAGEAAAVRLPGFPDLGQVPYTGCTGH
jgi:hypothetical protein